MDIDQLKLILDTIGAATEQAGDLVLIWLVLDKALPIFVLFSLIFCAYKLIKKIIDAFSAEEELAKFRDMLGVGCPGPLSNREKSEVIKRITDLIDKSKK